MVAAFRTRRAAGTGLESMRERAAEVGGEVAIERRPEGGTRVLARLPIGRADGMTEPDRRADDPAS